MRFSVDNLSVLNCDFSELPKRSAVKKAMDMTSCIATDVSVCRGSMAWVLCGWPPCFKAHVYIKGFGQALEVTATIRSNARYRRTARGDVQILLHPDPPSRLSAFHHERRSDRHLVSRPGLRERVILRFFCSLCRASVTWALSTQWLSVLRV